MKKLFFATAIIAFSVTHAQTWSDDVAKIFFAKCTKCHNANGIAPFSLMTYNDAVNWSTMIKYDVENGIMPPWPPDTTYRRLAHERILTTTEISTISAWVNSGTPSGNLSNAPAPPVYNGIAQMQNPDLVIQIPQYTVNTSSDDYRCFPLPSNINVKKFITSFEVLPGDRTAVHHVLVFADTSNLCYQLDANDPGPGYTNFGGTGSSSSKLIGEWVPGESMTVFPSGMGIDLLANSNIILQIHYAPGVAGKLDTTQVRFKLSSNWNRSVYIDMVLNHGSTMINGPLVLAPNTTKTFYEKYQVPVDVSLIGLFPHMHLIGRSIKSYAITPLNDTIPLINIPDWDFRWQGGYQFRKIQKIPKNSWLYADAFYDNTANNPWNPNNPPKWVIAGEKTTEEMMLVFFSWLLYFPGDENIVIDTNSVLGSNDDVSNGIVSTLQLYEPYPSPATDKITVEYYLPNTKKVLVELFSQEGKLVYSDKISTSTAGLNETVIPLAKLNAGIYILQFSQGNTVRTKKFLKE